MPVTVIEPVPHMHNYIPLWMATAVFVMIVVAYLYCFVTGTSVNAEREVAVLGISGIVMVISAYLNKN